MMFLSMSFNFGFLLMAVDRLRSEVADLALLDDLTGVGNRRHLLQRLTEECARSERSGEPFALLVIDLDGFKLINDTHGHAAGDACLQHFTLMAQTRLRPGDMLARTGGDEFCVVLPASTLREGAMIARRILDVCRADAEACVGDEIPISLSIGVAQWNREIGPHPDRLMAAADHALYAAKKDGKNRHAVYDPRAAAGAFACSRCRKPRCASSPEACYPFDMNLRLLMTALCAVAIAGPGRRADARSRDHRARPGHARNSRSQDGLAGALGRCCKGPSLAQHHRAPDRGPAGSARYGAQEQSKNPTRRGVTVWVETDGTVYWAVAENLVPTHGDGANRNDNKYIDNGPTYHQVTGNVSIGVEFAGNYPDVTRPATEAQVAAWRIL